MDINVDTRPINDSTQLIEIRGEIDVYTSPSVKNTINELIENGCFNLIISLENVRYIDSTGLGVLIGAIKRVREHDGRIVLVCNNVQIRKIFAITGLVKIFEIFETQEEATKALSPS